MSCFDGFFNKLLDLLEADPRAAGVDELERAVVRSSLALMRQTQESGGETSPPLPSEFQAVLRLDTDLRCCFVLRILVGYSNRDCALLLNLEAEDLETLVQTSLTSLSSTSHDLVFRDGAAQRQVPFAV